MNVVEVAYKIYEYRMKIGFEHPQVTDYQRYDLIMAELYLQFDRKETVEKFMGKFIGG